MVMTKLADLLSSKTRRNLKVMKKRLDDDYIKIPPMMAIIEPGVKYHIYK